MNTSLIERAKESWQPKSVELPQVDPTLKQMNSAQRASESLRYVLLQWEHWASPNGDVREWLRHNTRIGVWLFIPAIFVMPVIGLVLWQLTGWLAMLMSIVGRLIVLPILILLAFVVIKTVVALLKR